MNLDLGTLCLIAIFVVVGLMLLSRFMNSGGGQTGGTDFSQRGSERPTADSPDVDSRGGFGRDPAQSSDRGFTSRRPSFNMPIFRGSRRSGGGAGRVDNTEVKSRGSFGRPKGK